MTAVSVDLKKNQSSTNSNDDYNQISGIHNKSAISIYLKLFKLNNIQIENILKSTGIKIF